MQHRKTVAVIPARGGSKRIPRKNLAELAGKPLLAWTIDAALDCGLFERVVVSTDDHEISDVAKRLGADVPFLRDGLADDHATVSDVTCHVLGQLESELGERFENVVQLMPNCPLRAAADIRHAWREFERAPQHPRLSCFRFGWMNPWWAFQVDAGGMPTPLFPEALKARSQDLPVVYCPSGAIWISSVATLLEHRTFYAPGHRFFVMEWRSALDIDDEADLAMARALMLMGTNESTAILIGKDVQ